MGDEPQTDDVFDEADVSLLTGFARTLFPHPDLGDEPYRRAVGYLITVAGADANLTHQIVDALAHLRREGGGSDTAVSAETAKKLSAHDYFWAIRALVIGAFYADPEVRAFIGYPGPAFDLGGYLNRGFNDLAWLPEPRVTESAAAFIDIAEEDRA